jgi:TIR domain
MIKPQIFVSYSHLDTDYVHKVRSDLLSGNVDCWIDDTLQTGDKLSLAIQDAISRSSLFFAYITKAYLRSRWCMREFQYALQAPGVTVVPYADSEATLRAVPGELTDEVVFGILEPATYAHSLMQLVGRSWASLQTFRRVVPGDNHILAGPAIFDSTQIRRMACCFSARGGRFSSCHKTGLPALSTRRLTLMGCSRRSTTAYS